MNARAVYGMVVPLLLAGCAEQNFVPGSPMAKLAGYNRTYEQIAADQCADAGYVRGSEPHARCAIQIAASKRQQDAINRQRTSDALIAAGSAIAATPPPDPPNPNRPVCVDGFNKVYRC